MNPDEGTVADPNVPAPAGVSVFGRPVKDWQLVAIPIVAIVLAETLLYMGKLQAGIFLHVMIPLCLAVASMWIHRPNVSLIMEVLIMLPILRLVNISMPVFFGTTLYLYFFIYAPLAIPLYILIRHQRFTRKELGLTLKNLHIYLPLSLLVGLLIAMGEYNTIQVGSLIPDASIGSLLKISVVMFLFVGLMEELIFRSLLQTRLQESFGMTKGLLVAGLLFGMMHSGYGNSFELMVTGSAGILFGYMFQKTRSLPFITIAHGFVNVFLFGLIPLLSPVLGWF